MDDPHIVSRVETGRNRSYTLAMTLVSDKVRTASERLPWRNRIVIILMMAVAVGIVWMTNVYLTERFTETTRNRAQVRLALYSGNLLSELRRASVIPQLLSRDESLINALETNEYQRTTLRLYSYLDEIGAESLMLLDRDGRAVASTIREQIGSAHRSEPYFIDAIRSAESQFTVWRGESGAVDFYYSRRLTNLGRSIGVIVAKVDLKQFERSWAGISDAVIVSDSSGKIVLSTEPRWRGLTEEEALEVRSAPSAILRAIQATADWRALPPDAYLRGEAVMRQEARIPFRGWHMASYTTFSPVRSRVNGVIALEIMGFAILLSLAFYLLSRKAMVRSRVFQRESVELRALNERLTREIAEREKAEKNLQVAEQTIEQSSKLAALGEMSAAVSHELNQPLAAMKTYLAGAKLLLRRRRPEEALSSFQRIDDLIERMGAITRQLKSYARKGGEAFEPVDMRHAMSSALSMMEPQLKRREVNIKTSVPREPVMVMADRLRLEQVIINLLRNALDATKEKDAPMVELQLFGQDTARLNVQDNGNGIEDLESLFEPFYTTKQPGDGVGLGLAISSGIVNDLGGRLIARNAPEGGAVFEIQLPILNEGIEAAE